MANNQQKAIIHVLKGKLKLSDEHYRDMLAAYDVTSAADKKFTHTDAKEFIKILSNMCKNNGIETRRQQPHGMITLAQMDKTRAIWFEVSKQDTIDKKKKALDTFIENKFGPSKLEWVPSEMVSKIIRTLEAMRETSCRKNICKTAKAV